MLEVKNPVLVKIIGGQEGWKVRLFKPKFKKEAENQIAAIFEWDENSAKSFLDWEWRSECGNIQDALENEQFIKWASFAFAFLAKRMTYDGIVLDDDLLNPEKWKRILLILREWPLSLASSLEYIKSKKESLNNFFDMFDDVGTKIKKDRAGIATIKGGWKKSPYLKEADKYMELLWKIAWGKISDKGSIFRDKDGHLDSKKPVMEIIQLMRIENLL